MAFCFFLWKVLPAYAILESPMHRAVFNAEEHNVLAYCPDCDAITSFDDKGYSNTRMGISIVNKNTQHEGRNYSRILWRAVRCNVCSRGAIAKVLDGGNSQTAVLVEFIPKAVEKLALPEDVPIDIVAEFREAERDAAHESYRSGSALLRSVLEKTLTKNGYAEVEYTDQHGAKKKSTSLLHRIDAAANDGIITETRRNRAHEHIRVLGNDILHDDWREVSLEEYEDAHKYSQRILEDFYDQRTTVEARLKAKGRI